MGRFARDLEAQLVYQAGGEPSVAQRLVIERLVAVTIQLELFDDKLRSGNWTDLDSRTYSGLVGRQRVLARTVGLKEVESTLPTPHEYAAQRKREKRVTRPYVKNEINELITEVVAE
jgi:hypothetical protein